MRLSRLFLLSLLHQIVFCHSSELELLNNLTKRTSRYIRPTKNISRPIQVKFGIEIVHLTAIEEKDQAVSLKLWIRISWMNEYLQWNSARWGNVESTRLDYKSVWTPDIFLQEDMTKDMSDGPEKYKTRIKLHYSGLNEWFIPVVSTSSCIFDISDFPYDRQTCQLLFTSWTHDRNEIQIVANNQPIITKHYINSSQWDLIEVSKAVRSRYYDCCPHPFVDISYEITLQRRPLFYIFNIVVPCLIQMVIILFTFFLPPQSGERVGIVIAVLLVFAVYLEVLNRDFPKSSNSTPALTRFAVAAMAESALSILATCFVLILHFQGRRKGVEPIPDWARKLFICGIGKYLWGLYKPKRKQLSIMNRKYESIVLFKEDLEDSYSSTLNSVEPKKQHGGGYSDWGEKRHNCNDIWKRHKNGHAVPHDIKCNAVDVGGSQRLLNEVTLMTDTIYKQNKNSEISQEWEVLSKILDRLFALMFLVIFLFSTLFTLFYSIV